MSGWFWSWWTGGTNSAPSVFDERKQSGVVSPVQVKAKVVVIGGELHGLLTAYWLSKRGYGVSVISSNEVRSSFVSMICPSIRAPWSMVYPTDVVLDLIKGLVYPSNRIHFNLSLIFKPIFWKWSRAAVTASDGGYKGRPQSLQLASLSAFSLKRFQEVAESLQNSKIVSDSGKGTLHIYHNYGDLSTYNNAASDFTSSDVNLALLSNDYKVAEKEHILVSTAMMNQIIGGVYCYDGRSVDFGNITNFLVSYLRTHPNVQFIQSEDISRFQYSKDGSDNVTAAITKSGKEFPGDIFVIASDCAFHRLTPQMKWQPLVLFAEVMRSTIYLSCLIFVYSS
jgi:hypothetical protein